MHDDKWSKAFLRCINNPNLFVFMKYKIIIGARMIEWFDDLMRSYRQIWKKVDSNFKNKSDYELSQFWNKITREYDL